MKAKPQVNDTMALDPKTADELERHCLALLKKLAGARGYGVSVRWYKLTQSIKPTKM